MARTPTSRQEQELADPAVHEHAWRTLSAHPTSEGTVVYVRCVACGIHRVDLRADPPLPPTAISAEVAAPR